MAKRTLPTRVYLKHGAYYYVTLPERQWVRVGKSESEMYAALAKIKPLMQEAAQWLNISTAMKKKLSRQSAKDATG